jgi:hypothetical protein
MIDRAGFVSHNASSKFKEKVMFNRFTTFRPRQFGTFFSLPRSFSKTPDVKFETSQSKFDDQQRSLIKELKAAQKKYLASKTEARENYEATLPLFKRHLRPVDPSIDVVAQDASCRGMTDLLNKVLQCKTQDDLIILAPQIRDFKKSQEPEQTLEQKNAGLR